LNLQWDSTENVLFILTSNRERQRERQLERVRVRL